MADSLVCDHLCSTVHFSVLANGTDIGADTTGPVVFITDLYMVFCAGNFIHLVNAVLAFCETMGRAAFQAFSAVDAEIFLLHGICGMGASVRMETIRSLGPNSFVIRLWLSPMVPIPA